jgi:hypothetical protein
VTYFQKIREENLMNNKDFCFDEERSTLDSDIIGRRQLLKALAATSGAIVATQLPADWAKPVVEVGTLPAHAQISSVVTISNLQKTFTALNDCTTSSGVGSSNNVTFDYFDLSGNIGAGAVVHFSTDFNPGKVIDIDLFNTPGVIVTGNSTQGSILIPLCTHFGSNETVTNQVQLRNTKDDVSLVQSITVSRPLGTQSISTDSTEMLRK